MKFILLINVKTPTLVGILTFIGRINTTSGVSKEEISLFFSILGLCFLCLVFVMPLCASAYLCLVVTCWERAGFLALVVVYNCECVTFPLVSCVRCGT